MLRVVPGDIVEIRLTGQEAGNALDRTPRPRRRTGHEAAEPRRKATSNPKRQGRYHQRAEGVKRNSGRTAGRSRRLGGRGTDPSGGVPDDVSRAPRP